MNFRVLLLELILLLCLVFDEVKGHSNVSLSLSLEVKEAVRALQLVKVPLNIIVIVDVLQELGFPLPTLLIIHEMFTVHVVEINADLGPKWIVLCAIGIRSCLVVPLDLIWYLKIEP